MQISTNAGDKLCITPTAAMQISTNQFLTTVATFFLTRKKHIHPFLQQLTKHGKPLIFGIPR